jgi:hypothetical protein
MADWEAKLDRLKLMASPRDTKWDLSPNDRDAIQAVLIELGTRKAQVASLTRKLEIFDWLAAVRERDELRRENARLSAQVRTLDAEAEEQDAEVKRLRQYEALHNIRAGNFTLESEALKGGRVSRGDV